MDNKNPFEIRLELLKMAKDMLCEAYYAERELITREYENKMANGLWEVERPELPKYPTEEEIIAKAVTLNTFISSGKAN
jgi:hypothetical protein